MKRKQKRFFVDLFFYILSRSASESKRGLFKPFFLCSLAMSSSTKSLRMSWDRLTSKTLGGRRKKAGKEVSAGRELDETSTSTTTVTTTNDASDDVDEVSSRPPQNAPPPAPARPPALAPGVTAVVASASVHEEDEDDDDKGAVFIDASDVS